MIWLQPFATSSLPSSPRAPARQSTISWTSPTRLYGGTVGSAVISAFGKTSAGVIIALSESRDEMSRFGTVGVAAGAAVNCLSSLNSRYDPSPQVPSTTATAMTDSATIQDLWLGRWRIRPG